jgi:hypothetical protein
MALLNGIVVPILVEYLAEYKGEVKLFARRRPSPFAERFFP